MYNCGIPAIYIFSSSHLLREVKEERLIRSNYSRFHGFMVQLSNRYDTDTFYIILSFTWNFLGCFESNIINQTNSKYACRLFKLP